MVDAIWAMRFEQYSTEALREWVRKSRPGSESPADLAAIEELAKRVVTEKAERRCPSLPSGPTAI